MKNFNVSIIIPVYNQEINLLRQAILSAINQYGVNSEIIVVDDGSTNDLRKYLVEIDRDSILWPIQFCRIETHGKNQGVGAALNTGIIKASNDYIAWLSSDDYFYPEKTFIQISNMQESETLFSFTGFREIVLSCGKIKYFNNYSMPYGFDIVDKKTLHQDLLSRFPSCFINGASVIFHKKIIDDVGGFDVNLKYMQDYDMWLKISKKYNGLSCGDILMVKNSHENQMAHIFGDEHFKINRQIEETTLSSRYGVKQ